MLGAYAIDTPVPFVRFVALVPLWIGTVSGYLEFCDMGRVSYLVSGVPYSQLWSPQINLFSGFERRCPMRQLPGGRR